MPRGYAMSAPSLAEKNNKVSYTMKQIHVVSVMTVATISMGLWTLTASQRKGGGIINETKIPTIMYVCGNFAKVQGGEGICRTLW